jgi:uncharacterized OB-fold protein
VTVPVVSACDRCGWRGFPRRLWCPACGADALRDEEVSAGRVDDATLVRRAPGRGELSVQVGTVRLDGGGLLIARLEGARVGDQVDVAVADGALVARPLAPQ